jgi:hypothetical protein
MADAIRALVPMAFVRSVPGAMAFYRLLGFEPENTFTPPGEDEPSWAYLVAGRAQLMLARRTEPVDPRAQAVLFYAYCDDVAAFRDRLASQGIAAGAIEHPFYAPRGEFRIQDPDGHVVMVTHT